MRMSLKIGVGVVGGAGLFVFLLPQGLMLIESLVLSTIFGSVIGLSSGFLSKKIVEEDENYLPTYEEVENDILMEDNSESMNRNVEIDPPGYEEREADRLVVYEDIQIEENPPSYEEVTKENNLGNRDGKVSVSEVDIDGGEGNKNKGL